MDLRAPRTSRNRQDWPRPRRRSPSRNEKSREQGLGNWALRTKHYELRTEIGASAPEGANFMRFAGTIRSTLRHAALSAFAASVLAPCIASQVSSYGDKQMGAANETPSLLKKVGITQNLNTQLPLGLAFTDDEGKRVTLAGYLGKRPAILALVYYQCPMLCSEE